MNNVATTLSLSSFQSKLVLTFIFDFECEKHGLSLGFPDMRQMFWKPVQRDHKK